MALINPRVQVSSWPTWPMSPAPRTTLTSTAWWGRRPLPPIHRASRAHSLRHQIKRKPKCRAWRKTHKRVSSAAGFSNTALVLNKHALWMLHQSAVFLHNKVQYYTLSKRSRTIAQTDSWTVTICSSTIPDNYQKKPSPGRYLQIHTGYLTHLGFVMTSISI